MERLQQTVDMAHRACYAAGDAPPKWWAYNQLQEAAGGGMCARFSTMPIPRTAAPGAGADRTRLRELMAREGLPSLRALAARVGMDHTTVASLIHGRFQPSLQTLRAFQRAFPHYCVRWLFPELFADLFADCFVCDSRGAATPTAAGAASTNATGGAPRQERHDSAAQQQSATKPRAAGRRTRAARPTDERAG